MKWTLSLIVNCISCYCLKRCQRGGDRHPPVTSRPLPHHTFEYYWMFKRHQPLHTLSDFWLVSELNLSEGTWHILPAFGWWLVLILSLCSNLEKWIKLLCRMKPSVQTNQQRSFTLDSIRGEKQTVPKKPVLFLKAHDRGMKQQLLNTHFVWPQSVRLLSHTTWDLTLFPCYVVRRSVRPSRQLCPFIPIRMAVNSWSQPWLGLIWLTDTMDTWDRQMTEQPMGKRSTHRQATHHDYWKAIGHGNEKPYH